MISIFKRKKGSALIITLLIMGVLMTLALGLSNLVIREVRITSDILNAGKAFYAAEAGIESALLDLHQKLSGFQRDGNMIDGEVVIDINDNTYETNENLTFEYSIENKAKAIPFVDTEIINKEIAEGDPKNYLYNVLELNESLTIPLFIQNEDGTIQNINDFRVEYFIDAEIHRDWKLGVINKVIDMLRWKITGINSGGDLCSKYYDPNPNKLTTESIGDYIPVLEGTNYDLPSCFGTSSNSVTDDQSGIDYGATCGFLWQWAREAFVFALDADGAVKTVKYSEDENNPVTIKEFMDCHDTNYLTISNILNPEILQGDSDFDRIRKAKIYYRILIPNENEYVVRDFAKIKSIGSSHRSRKQIEAFIKPDTFMPVFNYSLYRTQVGGEGDKQNTQGYLETSGE